MEAPIPRTRSVSRSAAEKERFLLLFELNECSSLLTAETHDLTDIWIERGPEYEAVGLMLRCQRLIRGAACLIEHGFLDPVAPLVRPIIEASVTGLWLLHEGDSALKQMLGNERRETLDALRWIHGEVPSDLAMLDAPMNFRFQVAENGRLPALHKRAGDLYPYIKAAYLLSHTWVHATTHANALAVKADEMERRRDALVGLRPLNLLGAIEEAACVALLLGRQLHIRLGWNHVTSFDELLEGLNFDMEILDVL